MQGGAQGRFACGCLQQYNSPVSPLTFISTNADFVRVISRNSHMPISYHRRESQEVERQLLKRKEKASVVSSPGDLATTLGRVRPRRTLKRQFGFILSRKRR